MMLRRRPIGLLLGLGLLLCACGERDPQAQKAELDRLQRQAAELRARLKIEGRGAYAAGPTVRLDHSGGNTPLEALHRSEQQLQELQGLLEERNRHIAEQARRFEELRESSAAQKRENILLEKERTAKQITQHALQAAQQEIQTLNEQLGHSEHARLEIEKTFAEFATEFLQLRAMDTKLLADLQRRLRDRLGRLIASGTQEVADARPTP